MLLRLLLEPRTDLVSLHVRKELARARRSQRRQSCERRLGGEWAGLMKPRIQRNAIENLNKDGSSVFCVSQAQVFSISSLACAEVVVNMEDRVEVFRGQTAQISCTFESSEGIGGMLIQWFYVSGA